MTESQILVNCDVKSDSSCVSHLVNSIDPDSVPSVMDSGTTDINAANAKVLTSQISARLCISDNAGSKMSGSTPRSSRKRKRDGHKSRTATFSGDDSESGEKFSKRPSGSSESAGRKKRQRRRKNRKYKPYNKLSWSERREQDARETRRANNVRAQRFASGQPVAPYNTTQFLMEDHGDLAQPPLFPKMCRGPGGPQQRGARARDSSFSLDSEEDFYYSSPEDEKEFLTKEFSHEYEVLHAEQLAALPKARLVQDILSLEKRKEELEKEIIEIRNMLSRRAGVSNDEAAAAAEEGETEEDKALLYKAEISKLSTENNRLRAENECLRQKCYGDGKGEATGSISSSSSMDSESDSSSTGSCSSSSCSRSATAAASEGLPADVCGSPKGVSPPLPQGGPSPQPPEVVSADRPPGPSPEPIEPTGSN